MSDGDLSFSRWHSICLAVPALQLAVMESSAWLLPGGLPDDVCHPSWPLPPRRSPIQPLHHHHLLCCSPLRCHHPGIRLRLVASECVLGVAGLAVPREGGLSELAETLSLHAHPPATAHDVDVHKQEEPSDRWGKESFCGDIYKSFNGGLNPKVCLFCCNDIMTDCIKINDTYVAFVLNIKWCEQPNILTQSRSWQDWAHFFSLTWISSKISASISIELDDYIPCN